jgi:hypothetical protein
VSRVRLDDVLSFREAAIELQSRNDPRGRRLRNMVLARERQTGKAIAIRLSGEVKPQLRVSLGALFRAFPELAPAKIDDIARLMRPMVERMAARTKDVVREEIKAGIEPRIEYLEKHAEAVDEYFAKVKGIARPNLPRNAR